MAPGMEARSRLRSLLPRGAVGPTVLLLVSVLGIAAVVWGALVADPEIAVSTLDAGPTGRLAIGDVIAFEEVDVYLVVLEDGRVRAVDGIVAGDGCAVRWLPEDERGRAGNPRGRPGVYIDPCSEAVWAATGDAVSGTQHPLRTFYVSYSAGEEGAEHVYIEVIGRPAAR